MFNLGNSKIKSFEKTLENDKVYSKIDKMIEEINEQKQEYLESKEEIKDLENKLEAMKSKMASRIEGFDKILDKLGEM